MAELLAGAISNIAASRSWWPSIPQVPLGDASTIFNLRHHRCLPTSSALAMLSSDHHGGEFVGVTILCGGLAASGRGRWCVLFVVEASPS